MSDIYDAFYTPDDARPARIGGGYVLDGTPHTSATFVVTPGDAEGLEELLPPDTSEDTPQLEGKYISTVSSVKLYTSTPPEVEFVQTNSRGDITSISDGRTITYADDPLQISKPDPLAGTSLRDRKAAARELSIKPRITVTGAVGSPDGPQVTYRTGSWATLQRAPWPAIAKGVAAGKPVVVSLQPDSYIARSGPQAGRRVHVVRAAIGV